MNRATVIIDTREKRPYAFDARRVGTLRRALSAGDYSLEGHEERVAVERKTLEDLVSTVVHARERFRRELDRLSSYQVACVVVEGNLRDVLDGCYRSAAHPNAILGSIVSIIVGSGVPVFFCSDREAAQRFVETYLLRFHRKIQERLAVGKQEG